MGHGSRREARRAVVGLLARAVLGLLASAPAAAGEILYADGRREPAAEPRQDSKGQWTATRDGRRAVLRPGEVVVVVDDAGKETVTIPDLADGALASPAAPILESVRDPKNEAWREAAERLALHANRGLHDALVALAEDPGKEMRRRAIHALARLRTKESVLAAARAVLAEKDKPLRREAASVLYSVQEIYRRSDAADLTRDGLADKDSAVRLVFATLAPSDSADAIAVLKADGLKSTDHHVRESAAIDLARRGDRSGEAVLAGMLSRTRLPGIEGDDAFMERLLVAEQVEICGHFGKFGTATAKAALRKAASSRFEAVRKAAEAALAAAPAK